MKSTVSVVKCQSYDEKKAHESHPQSIDLLVGSIPSLKLEIAFFLNPISSLENLLKRQ